MFHEHERIQAKFRDDLGAEVMAALRDPSVFEVSVNADGLIWVKSFRGKVNPGRVRPEQVSNLINTVSTMLNRVTNEKNPRVGGEVWLLIEKDFKRFRFHGVIPPQSLGPMYSIRKPCSRVVKLSEYLDSKVISFKHYDYLKQVIVNRRSILISGGTMSGKTTFANAVLDEIASRFPDDRVAILEDTLELQCNVPDMFNMKTTPDVEMDALLKDCMRLAPTRIIVGEVRGKEAYSLIKACNTGHSGSLATVHASSAFLALQRLEDLVTEAGVTPSPQSIADAINVIVHIEHAVDTPAGRRVSEIIQIKGYNKAIGEYLYESI